MILATVLLGACAETSRRADTFARAAQFAKQVEAGDQFRHVIYRNRVATPPETLHVYIEGDGTPYWQPDLIAPDPTPRKPLMLQMMALDSAPSIYLGRPCYFGLYKDRACNALYWTSRRYGPEVLDSMEAVLRSEIGKTAASQVELYGHSGGGTLAVLLAERVKQVTRVITVGANLDITAWCNLHRFATLQGSINPIDEHSTRADLQTLHLVGDRDVNSPPSLLQTAAQLRGEPVRVVAKFDHGCCWQSIWRDILNEPR